MIKYAVYGEEYYNYSGYPREPRGVRCLAEQKSYNTREEAEAALDRIERDVKSRYSVKSSVKSTDEKSGETKIAIVTSDDHEIFLRIDPFHVKDKPKAWVLNVINGNGLNVQAFATRDAALEALRNALADEADGYYKNIGVENSADYDALLKEISENGHVFPEFTGDEYYLKEVEVQ